MDGDSKGVQRAPGDTSDAPSPARGARLRRELRDYAIVAGYLYACFGVLLIYKSAVLHDAGIDYLPHGLAAIKALILGKFMLIGEALGVGSRGERRSPARAIARKVLSFWLLLIVLSALEEGLKAAVHHRPFGQALADFFLHPIPEALAASLVMVLVLIPYVAAKEFAGREGGTDHP